MDRVRERAWNLQLPPGNCRRATRAAFELFGSATLFTEMLLVVIGNPLANDVLAAAPTPWDARVLADLTDLTYTRAVVFTDGLGRVLHRVTRTDPPAWIGELVDIASGGLSQMGSQLGLGTPGVCVCTFQSGVVILSRSEAARVAVLADEHANLGQLLNHVRHIFSRAVT